MYLNVPKHLYKWDNICCMLILRPSFVRLEFSYLKCGNVKPGGAKSTDETTTTSPQRHSTQHRS